MDISAIVRQNLSRRGEECGSEKTLLVVSILSTSRTLGNAVPCTNLPVRVGSRSRALVASSQSAYGSLASALLRRAPFMLV